MKPSNDPSIVILKLVGTMYFLTQILAEAQEAGVSPFDKGAIGLAPKNAFGEEVEGGKDVFQFSVPGGKAVRLTVEAFQNVADAPEVKEFELKEEKLPQLTQPNGWRSDGAMAGN